MQPIASGLAPISWDRLRLVTFSVVLSPKHGHIFSTLDRIQLAEPGVVGM